jgi:hypothetical protein
VTEVLISGIDNSSNDCGDFFWGLELSGGFDLASLELFLFLMGSTACKLLGLVGG